MSALGMHCSQSLSVSALTAASTPDMLKLPNFSVVEQRSIKAPGPSRVSEKLSADLANVHK